MALSCHR